MCIPTYLEPQQMLGYNGQGIQLHLGVFMVLLFIIPPWLYIPHFTEKYF